MKESPVSILERLLKGAPGPRNVHYLKASRDFYEADWTYEDVRAIEKDFADAFRKVAAQVAAAWGPPEFLGRRVDSPFPDWSFAEEMCYWVRGERLAMIWWEHQDKELPVLLVLAVCKREDLSE